MPLIRRWQELATTDPATIETWWRQFPTANVGIATGRKSGIVVLDVDPGNGGHESLERLKKDIPGFPSRATVRTGSGGLHYYFTYDLDLSIGNSASRLGHGLDVRGDGGFVVAPPSLHASGSPYSWIE
jgi:hypothetical protein